MKEDKSTTNVTTPALEPKLDLSVATFRAANEAQLFDMYVTSFVHSMSHELKFARVPHDGDAHGSYKYRENLSRGWEECQPEDFKPYGGKKLSPIIGDLKVLKRRKELCAHWRKTKAEYNNSILDGIRKGVTRDTNLNKRESGQHEGVSLKHEISVDERNKT